MTTSYRKVTIPKGQLFGSDIVDSLLMSIKPDKDHSMGELVGPIENCGYLDKQLSHRLLFAWGIFNPYGPTWSSLTLATIPDKRLSLIYLKISNPFSIKSYVHGWVQEPAESKTLMPLLLSMFSEPGKGQILKCAPTFIVCCSDYIANLDYIPTLMFRAFTLAGVKGLDEECEIMRKYWLKPWERTHGVGDLLMSFIKQHSLDAPKETGNSHLSVYGKFKRNASIIGARSDDAHEASGLICQRGRVTYCQHIESEGGHRMV